ncbi:hypothetical protein [Thalassovita sp.]|jgi:hypothetical protein|uniref:hypothetical protein n=1 Tax=Thalassovita sp. TaxID=1979401 RepID=UPI0029DE5743|nr:hypothetical protein [Thalassovita sp.]
MFFKALIATVFTVAALPVAAQSRDDEAMRIARESRLCGDRGILRAEFRRHGNVGVLCEGASSPLPPAEMGEATNFIPLIGGLGPILGLGGGALVVGALGSGSSTSDTQ